MNRYAFALLAALSCVWLPNPRPRRHRCQRPRRAADRLEGQNRQLSGQVEQLQFDNRQLREQLRKFQEDVEFRLSERAGARPAAPVAIPPAGSAQTRPRRRRGPFGAATPSILRPSPAAPGAPRTLGQAGATPSAHHPVGCQSSPGRRDGIASIIEGRGAPVCGPARHLPSGACPFAQRRRDQRRPEGGLRRGLRLRAAAPVRPGRDGVRRYIQSHPRDRFVSDATYWLGESYLQRSRFREAARAVSQGLDRLHALRQGAGRALQARSLAGGARREGPGCATFAELERKYPTASTSVKQGVEREQKKARCAA
jgi:TolA-binding protein